MRKRCPQCGETKDISGFYPNKHTKSGISCYCKLCMNTYTNARYHNEPDNRKYILGAANARYARIQSDPEFIRKHHWESHRDRARKFGVDGTFTIQEGIDLISDYGGRCAYCGSKVEYGLDHVVPLSRGGMNSIDNIVPCCDKCNDLKHNTPLLVWMFKMKNMARFEVEHV